MWMQHHVHTISVTDAIDLSSPSSRTQTSQWQSSISCMVSGTRTSLGFSAIEKHWRIRSSHQFYGVYASKMEKLCAWGIVTDSRYPETMGNIINFITFPESKQNRAKYIQPQSKWRQKRFFAVTIFICSSRTLMLSCALMQGISG